jgi:hypothetical protein
MVYPQTLTSECPLAMLSETNCQFIFESVVQVLKALLKSQGLPRTGKKVDLVDHLMQSDCQCRSEPWEYSGYVLSHHPLSLLFTIYCPHRAALPPNPTQLIVPDLDTLEMSFRDGFSEAADNNAMQLDEPKDEPEQDGEDDGKYPTCAVFHMLIMDQNWRMPTFKTPVMPSGPLMPNCGCVVYAVLVGWV